MNKETKIFLIISLIVIILIIYLGFQEPSEPQEFVKNKTFSNYSTLFFYYEISRYPSSVEIKPLEAVSENITLGFVTDPWNINFGIIPGNGILVKRTVELTNLKDENSKVILRVYGNISPLVSFSENNFIMHPHEKASIEISLYDNDTKKMNYTGEIDVISKKAIYNFLPIS